MTEPIFTIQTSMNHRDYKNFLYISTFCKNKLIIPLIFLLSLSVSILLNLTYTYFSAADTAGMCLIFFAVSMVTIILKIEFKTKKRIKTDKIGDFNANTILNFYEDYLQMQTNSSRSESTASIEYNKFYMVVESQNYFFFYINASQAFLLGKRDIGDSKLFKAFITRKFDKSYQKI